MTTCRTRRPGPRPLLAVTAALLALGAVAGCSDDDAATGPSASSSASSSSEPSASAEATPSEEGTQAPTDPADLMASDQPEDASSQAAQTPEPGLEPGDAGYVEPEEAPVDVSQTQSAQGAQVQVGLASVEAEAALPGEVGGAAVQVTVTVTAAEELDLSSASVVLWGADGAPAVGLSGNGAQDLPTTAAAGETVTGTYVFSAPAGGGVEVRVSTAAGSPVLVFTGTVP